MTGKRIFTLLFILLVISMLMIGCSRNAVQETAGIEEDYIPVEVESIKKEALANKITLNGKIYANEEVTVMPQTPGTVAKVNIKLGDDVAKDQVLFVMDQKDIQNAIEQAEHSIDLTKRGVEQAESGIKSAKINYESTKESLEDALATLERTKTLYEAGAIPKTQLEQAEMAASSRPLETAEAQVLQAEISYQQALNQLSQAQSSYEQAKGNLDNTLVKAPIRGVVSSLSVVEGQLASNAQGAATIADIDSIYLKVDVTENMVNRLHQGQEVSVKVEAALNGKIEGRIDYISSTTDAKTQLYTVKVYIHNKEGKIRSGMSGSIELDVESRQNVLTVRSSAVIDKEGEQVVYLVVDERAVEQKVRLGLNTGIYIEVMEGLKEEDVVIIKGQHYVAEGQKVKAVRGE